MFKNLIIILFLFQQYISQAQDKTRTYYADDALIQRERFVDFSHLKLEVSFVPKEKLVRGKVQERFTVLRKEIDTLFLDAIDMTFFEVKLDGEQVEYVKYKNGITLKFPKSLHWNEKHEIEIVYEAIPKKGLYFIGWDDPTGRSRKQIWTQGQGIDNRHWIPMYDERNNQLVSEMIVTFDAKYKVLSNGKLVLQSELKEQNKTKWHYQISHRHAPYLIMLGIGDYGIKSEKSASGVPMNFYYYPGQENQIEPTYRYSKEMFEFFEKEIGVPYPWETYSQIPVQDFIYGAMENTTATIFGDFYLIDSSGFLDRNYVRVNAHELAHQWFGDMVTARSAAHHWLQESFATHYDLMYQKEAFGEDHYNWVRRDYNNQAIEESKKNLKPIAHSEGGTVRHYPKGAHVLQMLKYVVGRKQFNAAIKYYLEKHAYSNVDSDDLLTAFHEKLGLSLDWFWEEWVYKGDEPHYLVDFKVKKDLVRFEVIQMQEEKELSSTFRMPIVFEVYFEDGSKEMKRVMVECDTSEIQISLKGRKIEYVLFDPNSEVMKQVAFEKSKDMWKAQAEKAEHMIDRYDALVSLSDLNFKDKDNFFLKRFEQEYFHGIKSLIVKELSGEKSKLKEEIVLKALTDEDAEVRKTALFSISEMTPKIEQELIKCLKDSSYKNVETALEVLCVSNLEGSNKYLELTNGKVGNRSRNIEITWLKIATIINKDRALAEKIVDYTSDSYEFLTRTNAMQALRNIQYLNEDAMNNLLEARFHFNSRLRNSAATTLDYFAEIDAYKSSLSVFFRLKTLTEKQKEVFQKYIID
ncbi:M1 family metallopeptidase [Vicingaceae bacterium]|nr:M1 family metallopeptidase [Vicingaceae bacterium]